MSNNIYTALASLLVHLWRLLKAYTTQRKLEAEVDRALQPPLIVDETRLFGTVAVPPPVQEVYEPDEHTEIPLPVDPTPANLPKLRLDLAPLEVGQDGWLVGDKVVRVPSKRGGFIWRTGTRKAGGILWHWTATAWGSALGMAKRIVNGHGPSVHCWIEHDGTIYQSVPFTKGSGHADSETAARCAWKDGKVVKVKAGESYYSVNSFMLGIEIVNIGQLLYVKKKADGSYERVKENTAGGVWMGWPFGRWKVDENGKKYVAKGPVVKDEFVVHARDQRGSIKTFHMFTQSQQDAAERLVRACYAEYGFSDEAMSWGHVDVDPTRKSDPGPVWKMHMEEILQRVGE